MSHQSQAPSLEIPWAEVAAGLNLHPDALEPALKQEQVQIDQEVVPKQKPEDPQYIRMMFRHQGRETTIIATLQMPQETPA